MSDLRELYQEVILDHGKRPRNFGKPDAFDRSADGHNPLCGDRMTIYLTLDGDTVTDVRFDGAGCAISTASASMMTQMLKGKKREEVETLFAAFREMVTGDGTVDEEGLGKLAIFAGVRDFPVRIKCATLAWHTIRAALAGGHEPVSTE